MSYLWKDLKSGKLIDHTNPAPTREELFARSSLAGKFAGADLTKPIDGDRFLIVKVGQEGGKWVEIPDETEADRIWRLIVDASST